MSVDEARYRAAEERLWEAEGATPTERWLDLSRTGSRVRLQVVGEGPPVLFVHGASNSGTSWAPLVARLGEFRCLVLDRPGCGLSDRLETRFDDVDAFIPFAESLVVDVFDALGLESAHVVSTSLGGYHALRTAAAHPNRVRSVLELGWTVGAPIEKTPLIMRLGGVRSLGRIMSRIPVSTRMARSMLSQIGLRQALEQGRIPPEGVDWFRAQINHTDTMRNEIDAGPPILHPLRGVNDSILLPDEVLGRIRTPTSFFWGGEDLFGGEAVATAFAARIPDARLEMLPGAGHAVWMDDPVRTADVARAFLGRPADGA